MFFEVINLKKWFGGLKAVNEISISIVKGEICSVIGPNGAGKTTLFNLITGYIKPDSGKVIFLGEDITGKSAKDITERGIARSFQIVNIFPRLSVYENIMVAVQAKHRKSSNIVMPARSLLREQIFQLVESIGLANNVQVLGGELSHGNQKRLEVGIALAMQPKLLLLDEPTSGMAAEEKAGVLATIKKMTSQQGCTVFLCEHDMSVIFEVSDTIWVLNNGQVITHGNVSHIKNDETVRRIYLGERE